MPDVLVLDDSSPSSSPYTAVVVAAAVQNVDGDYGTHDFVESRDLLPLEIDSDKQLSLLRTMRPTSAAAAAADNKNHLNHQYSSYRRIVAIRTMTKIAVPVYLLPNGPVRMLPHDLCDCRSRRHHC